MRRAPRFAAAIVFTWAAAAHGQSDRELATRQDLIRQARDMREQGNHAEALALAKRGAAIRMTASLRMFVAQEEAALGRVADAYGNARQCVAEAEGDVKLHDRDRILAACRTVVESVEKRVARITLKLGSQTPPGLRVTLSGEDANVALLGAPYVISPGKVTVTVTATGYLPYKSEVEVPEGGATEVGVDLVVDPNAPCPDGQERVQGSCVARVIEPTRTRTGSPSPSRKANEWVGPLVVGGAGVVVGVIATGLYVHAGSTYASLKAQCTSPGGCTSSVYESEGATIRQDSALGVGGWVLGATLIAAGAAWFVLSAPKETARPAKGARFWLNPAARSVGVEGSF